MSRAEQATEKKPPSGRAGPGGPDSKWALRYTGCHGAVSGRGIHPALARARDSEAMPMPPRIRVGQAAARDVRRARRAGACLQDITFQQDSNSDVLSGVERTRVPTDGRPARVARRGRAGGGWLRGADGATRTRSAETDESASMVGPAGLATAVLNRPVNCMAFCFETKDVHVTAQASTHIPYLSLTLFIQTQ
jgi:hypothetical protein